MKKIILVTGASGFLGANLYKFLVKKDKYQLFLCYAPRSNWRLTQSELARSAGVYELDLTHYRSVQRMIAKSHPHIVFNLAAAGVDGNIGNWQNVVKSNVMGVTNLFSALTDCPPEHFIQMGTCFEYGSNAKDMIETDPLNPLTIYSASKVSSTFLALNIGRAFNFPVTVFRAFTLYGPYDNPFRLVSWVILTLLRGEEIIKLTSGKKEQVKDFLYVDDFVWFLDRFVRKSSSVEPFQIFNIGHHEQVSVEQLIREIANIMGKRVEIEEVSPDTLPFPARKTEYARVVSDSRKAKRILGWKSPTSLHQGLKKTVEWFTQHHDLYSYE